MLFCLAQSSKVPKEEQVVAIDEPGPILRIHVIAEILRNAYVNTNKLFFNRRIMGKYIIAAALLLTALFEGCLLNEDPYPPPVENTGVQEITAGMYPSVSPDGKKLSFSLKGANYICDTSGMNTVQLTSGVFNDIMPQWKPNGGSVGFIRQGNGAYGLLMNVDTAQKFVMTVSIHDSVLCRTGTKSLSGYMNNNTERNSAPVWGWSPSGEYAAFYKGNDTSTQLAVIRSDGTGKRMGTYPLFRSQRYDYFGNTSGFCWLPPGNNIIIASSVLTDTSFLYVVSVGSDSMVRMTEKKHIAYPTCSADGRYIGFRSYYSVYGYYILDRQTGFFSSTGGAYSPKLSPNGKYVVSYSYSYSGNPDAYPSSVLVCANVSTGMSSTIALSDWDYSFVFDPSSRYVYLSRGTIIRRVPLPQ